MADFGGHSYGIVKQNNTLQQWSQNGFSITSLESLWGKKRFKYSQGSVFGAEVYI